MFFYQKNLLRILLLSLSVNACTAADSGHFGQFKRSLNTTEYGYRQQPDPTGIAPTKQVEVFEVHPGDCGQHSRWSDCATDRERSELSQSQKDNYPGDEYWYGWSVYLPPDFPNIYPTKTTLGQFHQKDSHPVWMFLHTDKGLYLSDHVFGRTRKNYQLISEKSLRGKWHHIEIHARWAKDNQGFFQVWVDSKQKVNYKGQTMDAQQVYFKYGIYRAFLSRFKSKYHKNAVPSQTVYYSNVKRGYSRAAFQSKAD